MQHRLTGCLEVAELGFCGFVVVRGGGSVSGAGVVAGVFGGLLLLWHCWVEVLEVDWWVGVVGVEWEWEWEWEWEGRFHGFAEVVVVVSWGWGSPIVLMDGCGELS